MPADATAPPPLLAQVEVAESAAFRCFLHGFPGKRVYRTTPGCTRGCASCDIACAIMHGRAADLRAEYEWAQPSSYILVFDTDADTLTVEERPS